MHTLHTKAAAIFSGWAQEAEATQPATDSVPAGSMTSTEEIDTGTGTGTGTLWITCWCPLLQGNIITVGV